MSNSILSYFKCKSGNSPTFKSSLPPNVVASALKEVNKVQTSDERNGRKRGSYGIFSAKDKAKVAKYASFLKVAKYASENVVTASLKYFKRTQEFTDLKEPTVRGWVKVYWRELSCLGAAVASLPEMPENKQGRPLLLGEDLESQVKQFILEMREHGSPVGTEVVVAAAKGIVEAKDPTLLIENGGTIDITKDWGRDCLVGWDLLNANVPRRQRKQAQKNLKNLNYNFLRILKL